LARQGRRVYFSACDLIVQQLLRAKRELELDKLLKKLSRFDALSDVNYKFPLTTIISTVIQ
jgi:hypothetical protein